MRDSKNEVKPIAEFHCKSLLWEQSYSLFSDRITVDTKHRFSGDSQATHLLTNLTPFPTRGSLRGDGMNWGILLLFVGFGWIALHYFIGFSEGDRVPSSMIILGIAGLIWLLRSIRKWHYASFFSVADVQVLSLWSSPKSVDSFDHFVEACVTAIESATPKG